MKKKGSEKNQTEKNQTKIDVSKDYRYSTLTLLAQENAHIGTCPAPEDLALFADGKLKGRKRETMMAHLADCHACRHQWELLGSVMDEMDVPQATFPANLYRKVKAIRLSGLLAGSGFGLALTACLLLIFLVPQQNELDKMLTRSFGAFTLADTARYNSFATRGADQPIDKSDPIETAAYQAGAALGKLRLAKQSETKTGHDFEEERDRLFFSLGQWIVLLQCACISQESATDDFWPDQVKISTALLNDIKGTSEGSLHSKDIPTTLASLADAVQEISATGNKFDGCSDIVYTIETLENLLSIK